MIDTATRQTPRARTALSKATFTCATALCAAAGLGVLDGPTARADHYQYVIAKLGDPALKDTNGLRSFPSPALLNNVGEAVINQNSFDGSGASTGRLAWYLEPNDQAANSPVRIGLFDGAFQSDHTSSGNIQVSTVLFLTDTGFAGGNANIYQGGATQTGQSAWLFSANEPGSQKNKRVGLLDSEHTKQTGANQLSSLFGLNSSGTAVGTSDRFLGDTSAGVSVFVQGYNDSTATEIGLGILAADTEHRITSGTQTGSRTSSVFAINDLGDVSGLSNRYNGSTAIGHTAWLRTTDGNTKKLGFLDAEHTRTDGRRESSIVAMNSSSTVVGHSDRYTPSFANGQTAWIQGVNDANPITLGFTDTTHTSGNNTTGLRSSTVEKLNDGGYAYGFSNRYSGTSDAGQSAWFYSPSNGSQRVGLTDDAGHIGTVSGVTTYQKSTVKLMSYSNSAAYAAGTSSHFTAANALAGTSAWRFKDGDASSDHIGLFDDGSTVDHTRDDGTQNSSVVAMNNAGLVVGNSTRYKTGQTTDWGQSAWISDGASTTPIGLTDSTHVKPDGFQSSTVQFINASGDAVGTSERYDSGGASLGHSSWFYDGTTSIPLVFSTDASGIANTDVTFLSDDGVALGTYHRYSGSTDLGTFAFLWDYSFPAANRFYELGNLVQGGLSTNGWDALTQVLKMSPSGHILGVGDLSSGSGGGAMPFVLTPVPEPTGIALLAATGLLVLPRRRRTA